MQCGGPRANRRTTRHAAGLGAVLAQGTVTHLPTHESATQMRLVRRRLTMAVVANTWPFLRINALKAVDTLTANSNNFALDQGFHEWAIGAREHSDAIIFVKIAWRRHAPSGSSWCEELHPSNSTQVSGHDGWNERHRSARGRATACGTPRLENYPACSPISALS